MCSYWARELILSTLTFPAIKVPSHQERKSYLPVALFELGRAGLQSRSRPNPKSSNEFSKNLRRVSWCDEIFERCWRVCGSNIPATRSTYNTTPCQHHRTSCGDKTRTNTFPCLFEARAGLVFNSSGAAASSSPNLQNCTSAQHRNRHW